MPIRSGVILMTAILLSTLAVASEPGDLRARIRETFFIPEALPALDTEFHGTFAPEPGITVHRVSYTTLHGMRVPALVYVPDRVDGRAPAVIVVNGHGGDKTSWYAAYAGILYARAGAVVLTYDPLGEGERNPARKSGSRAHDNLSPKSRELGRRVAGSMVSDLMQAVRYLQSRPDVDPKRIAAVGYSLGGMVLNFTGALEPNLAAIVICGAGNLDEPGGYWDNAKPLCSGYPYQSLGFLGDRVAQLYALRAEYGPTLVVNGLEDEIVNMRLCGPEFMADVQRRARALAPTGAPVFETEWIAGASHRPWFVTRTVALWLERQIDFPNWDAASIAAMPETHVSEWAKANHVPMDGYYATEHREGGTRALGEGVPGLSREQLFVFSPEEWEAQKEHYSIAEWEKKVRAEMRPAAELVSQGRALARIVMSPAASAPEKEACAELQHYLEVSTGATLPIVAESDGDRILLGRDACPEDVRRELDALPAEGFLVRVLPDGALVLAGRDPAGTRHAVCDFLEHELGVRWLWPGELGEVVPGRANLRVSNVSRSAAPAFRWRDLGPDGPLWGALEEHEAARTLGISMAHQRESARWQRRMRFGGHRVKSGHAFAYILPPTRYGRKHPEYYALVGGKRQCDPKNFDGKHGCQPCPSHPDVIEITTAYCREYCDAHPECDVVSIAFNDSLVLCECDLCHEQNAPEANAADRMLRLANSVAEKLERTHPGKGVMVLAYQSTMQPPCVVRPRGDVMVQLCLESLRHAGSHAADVERLAEWSESGAWMSVYDYYIRGAWPDLPRLRPDVIAETVAAYRAAGATGFQTQSGDGYAVNGLNYYLLGKLLWDPELDARALRRDWLTAGFGSAATAVGRYFDRLEAASHRMDGVLFNRAVRSEYAPLCEALSPETLAALRRDLREAHAGCNGRERERVEFLVSGLRALELTADAARRTLALLDAGWHVDGRIVPPADADYAPLRAAFAAWRERERFVDEQRDGFAIAALWILYNDRSRSWNPLRAMHRFGYD